MSIKTSLRFSDDYVKGELAQGLLVIKTYTTILEASGLLK